MVFSSTIFLFYFLPIAFLLYLIGKKSNITLLLFSLFFYYFGEQNLIFIMLFSACVDFYVGKLIYKHIQNNQKVIAKKYLFLSVFINIGLLLYFKYANFFIQEINSLSVHMFNYEFLGSFKEIIFPLGISFYTFQSLSYSIDIYKEKITPTNSISNFFTFVTLFPQLVAGPIVRYSEIKDDLVDRRITLQSFTEGIERFCIGFIKKVLIANNISEITSFYNQGFQLNFLEAWLFFLIFPIYLYFDFSAYSDMAIGLGRMFGFNFPENFNYPFISKSLREYWSRWHMTLSRWLKDNLFFNLNASGKISPTLNSFFVFFLCGVWHGSSWGYIMWGLYNGVMITLEKLIINKYRVKLPNILQILYSYFFFSIGVMFVAAESLKQNKNVFFGMFNFKDININQLAILELFNYQVIFLIIGIIFSFPLFPYLKKNNNFKFLFKGPIFQLCLIVLFLISIAELVSTKYKPFFYFRF